MIHYTTGRICEHRHVMHYTTHRICEHSHVMQHTLPSAEPLVRKFSPLSPLITTAPSSLSYNYPSFHPPIPTSREPQPSPITIPGFLQPVIVVHNIPNLVLPATHIQCQDVLGDEGTNLHQTLMQIGEELYAVPAVYAW